MSPGMASACNILVDAFLEAASATVCDTFLLSQGRRGEWRILNEQMPHRGWVHQGARGRILGRREAQCPPHPGNCLSETESLLSICLPLASDPEAE